MLIDIESKKDVMMNVRVVTKELPSSKIDTSSVSKRAGAGVVKYTHIERLVSEFVTLTSPSSCET